MNTREVLNDMIVVAQSRRQTYEVFAAWHPVTRDTVLSEWLEELAGRYVMVAFNLDFLLHRQDVHLGFHPTQQLRANKHTAADRMKSNKDKVGLLRVTEVGEELELLRQAAAFFAGDREASSVLQTILVIEEVSGEILHRIHERVLRPVAAI